MKNFIQVRARLVESGGVFANHLIAVDSIALVAPYGNVYSRIVLKAVCMGSNGQVANEAFIAESKVDGIQQLLEEAQK